MRLHLTRIRIEQMRRFREPFELVGLEAGLNIVAGPNEAGKSTLARAVRAAFLERCRSTAVEDLAPWDVPSASPGVEIDFTFGGRTYLLAKRFLKTRRCTLRVDATLLDGDAAETNLATLFGFGLPARGASRPEHWGIPGLLWVEQGAGQELPVGPAEPYLHEALEGGEGAVGALASTEGDRLLGRLRAARDALLTPKDGRPRGDHADAQRALEALQAEAEAQARQIAEYRQQVDRLASLRGQLASDAVERPEAAMFAQLEAARERARAHASARARIDADVAELARRDETLALIRNECSALAAQREEATARRGAADAAVSRLDSAMAALDEARRRRDDARAASGRARDALLLARQEAMRSALQTALVAAQADAARSEAALAQAQTAHDGLSACLEAARTLPRIGDADMAQLRALERAARDASLRCEALATRLRHRLPPGQRLTLSRRDEERPLEGDGELLLDAPAALALPDGGMLWVTPGGGDLESLTQARDRAEDALRRALQAMGVRNLAEAELRHVERVSHERQIALARQALRIVAPDGLEPLQVQVREAQGRIHEGGEALARMPARPAGPVMPLSEAETEAEARLRSEQAAERGLAERQQACAAAQAHVDAAMRERDAAEALLQDAGWRDREVRAHQRLLEVLQAREALAGAIGEAEAALRAARPDILAQDIARLERSLAQHTLEQRRLRDEVLTLEGALGEAGALGLEEGHARTTGALERARRRRDELCARAQALDLLCRRLAAHRQATLASLLAPLEARIRHYLPLLMPQAEVRVAETFVPTTITRPGPGGLSESSAVGLLSFGAREQLALIARLAYADLLVEAGRPTLLILDDVLAHSDITRLAQMKRVLFDAAQRHQILLLTCHPEQWRDMGVPIRRLPA